METFKKILLKIESISSLRSIRKGLTVMMPIFLIGSLVLLMMDSPFNGVENVLMGLFGENWHIIAEAIYRGTFEIMSIFALVSVSYYYALEKEIVKNGEINVLIIVMSALSSYSAYNYITNRFISLSNTGPGALFKAIIIAIAATWLFVIFYKFLRTKTQKFESKINSNNIFRMALHSIIPVFLTILLFSIIGLLLAGPDSTMIIFKVSNIISYQMGFDTTGISILFSQLLWAFGIHGGNVVESLLNGLNQLSPAINNLPISGGASNSKSILDAFVYLGGAGSTLGLIIAILILRKKSSERNIAKLSSLFSVFNINEILIYGLPIVFNPYYLIPFILTPFILFLVTNLAIAIGFITPLSVNISWTTPIFVSGYLLTDSLAGVMLQLFNLVLAVLIYLPFVKLQNDNQSNNEKIIYNNLLNEIILRSGREGMKIINRDDEIGGLARSLVFDFDQCLEGNNQLLHLEYQPKTDADMKTIGAEALIRCIHPEIGYISPLVIITLCDDAGLTNKLGTWVIEHALYDMTKIHEELQCEIPISINLDPKQLRTDEALISRTQNLIKSLGVNPRMIEFEITENAQMDSSEKTLEKIEALKEMGVTISLDDFSMGHSSLTYLNRSYIDVVKLDAKLVQNIDGDEQLQHVTEALINLCLKLDISIIAEGVETRHEFETLQKLKCLKFQGFYFSPSLKPRAFVKYASFNEGQI